MAQSLSSTDRQQLLSFRRGCRQPIRQLATASWLPCRRSRHVVVLGPRIREAGRGARARGRGRVESVGEPLPGQ